MESLELLVLSGETRKVKRLLRKESYKNDEVNTGLISAALTGNQRLILRLIEAGADKESITRALIIAAPEGETSYSLRDELCRRNGLNPNVVSTQKNRAQEKGDYIQCVKVLLSFYIIETKDILKALKHAALLYRIKSVEVMLNCGIDVRKIPLTEFFTFEQFEMNVRLPEKNDLLRMFIQAGIDVNTDEGKTLSKAILHGYDEFVQKLLDAGAKLDNAYGHSNLVYAAERGDIELVEKLLVRGASIDEEDLLYSVAFKGQSEMLKYLIEKGTGPNQTEYIDLALEGAAEAGHIKSVKLLLKKGANPKAIDGSALKLASENGHTRIVTLLKNQKIDE